MDVALENVQKWTAEGATQKTFCEISQAKGQSGKSMPKSVLVGYRFSMNFIFSEAEPFVGLAFFFVCTNEKGLETNEYGSACCTGQHDQ